LLDLDSDFITWPEFVNQLLFNRLVADIFVNRSNGVALVRTKKDVEINGFHSPFYWMQVSPGDIEEKLNKAQNDLNMKPEERVSIIFKDKTIINDIFQLLLVLGIFYALFKFGK
jgi:hypothetical protein